MIFALMMTTGRIFKRYYVRVHMGHNCGIPKLLDIEVTDRNEQLKLFDLLKNLEWKNER